MGTRNSQLYEKYEGANAVGCNWSNYTADQLACIAGNSGRRSVARIATLPAQDYKYWSPGIADLIPWRCDDYAKMKVGASIFRAVQRVSNFERLAPSETAFLRLRTLDIAVITARANQLVGFSAPEPLARAIGFEMEKYFSPLWHCALLGTSAEC